MDSGLGSHPADGSRMTPPPDARPPATDSSGTVPRGDTGATAGALLAAFTDISSDLDTHSVLDRILVSAAGLTGARAAALAVVGSDDAVTEVVVHAADPAAAQRLEEQVRRHGT